MRHDNPADLEEILRMANVLGEAGYRELSRTANGQRIAVARRLFREGVNEDTIKLLWAYAQECGSSPRGLFAYWIQLPSRTMAKIQEMRTKRTWAKNRAEEIAKKGRVAPIIDMLSRRLGNG